MNSNHEEKLSQIQRMIALAKVDGVTSRERDFIQNFAKFIGVSEADVNHLFLDSSFDDVYPETDDERIFFFQSLVLLTGIDSKITQEEKDFLRELAIHLGLNPMSTEVIIHKMQEYPNFMIPENDLLAIYKTNYN